jgi:Tol biopolymer transport system component
MTPEEAFAESKAPFRLAEWTVEPDARAGRVVSREELRNAVWGETVVCDQNLTRAIWELRNSLGDDPESPRIIETIRKGGYRLIAPVTPVEPSGLGPTGAGSAAAASADSGPPPGGPAVGVSPVAARGGGRRRPSRAQLTVALVVVIVAIAALRFGVGSSDRNGEPAFLAAAPLTTAPGRERYPAISPDGTRVAFSWKGETGESYDIWVKQVNAESRLRLTEGKYDEVFPAWSPDGSTVAFLRASAPQTLCTVPAIGGPVREIAPVGRGVRGIDWSPDGRWIAYTSYEGMDSPGGIRLISPETGETRVVTSTSPRSAYDFWPRFSPSGDVVAFLRSGNRVQMDVYVAPADGGESRRLTHMLCSMAGMDWALGGDRLVLSASEGQDHLLWLVSSRDGASELLPVSIAPALYPSVASEKSCLVYETSSVDRDIWRLELGGDGDGHAEPARHVGSTRVDCCPEFSPDGSRILFLSTRSGHKEVWICERDGSRPQRLTTLESLSVRPPRWSPDGERIAFSAFLGDRAQAFTVEVESGIVRALRSSSRQELVDSWSRDGAWLYLHCSDDTGWRGEKVRADGAETLPLAIDGARVVFETDRGELLHYRSGAPGIWRSVPGDSTSHRLVDPEDMSGWIDVTFVRDGVFFIRRSEEGEDLGFHDYASGEAETLARLEGFGNAYLAVSPDRRTVLFDRPERDESDLVFVSDL